MRQGDSSQISVRTGEGSIPGAREVAGKVLCSTGVRQGGTGEGKWWVTFPGTTPESAVSPGAGERAAVDNLGTFHIYMNLSARSLCVRRLIPTVVVLRGGGSMD